MYSFFDDFGLPVTLTFDPKVFRQRTARHVLVFPFLEGKLLFTRHRQRGIELPGGKVEPGETSLAAAVRETFEETGYSLSAIEQIGQYVINDVIVKDIYVARVDRQVAEPAGADVEEALLFDVIPQYVKDNPHFSRYLYDDVYPLTLAHLRHHRFVTP
ncbi:NUDIX domain-containing protein [Brevibacillus sp. H7]|uniref:NUDIX domain-containing protein n=1 Tax=Brevibacillus sp. H7 TaxID=3349138 RepID=UPI00380DC399